MATRNMHVLSKAVRLDIVPSATICCSIAMLLCAASMHVLPMRSNQIFLLDANVLCLMTRYRRKGRVSRIVVPQYWRCSTATARRCVGGVGTSYFRWAGICLCHFWSRRSEFETVEKDTELEERSVYTSWMISRFIRQSMTVVACHARGVCNPGYSIFSRSVTSSTSLVLHLIVTDLLR
jgi:hypothetical protein